MFNNPEEKDRAPFAALQAGNGSVPLVYLPLKSLPILAAAQTALALLRLCCVFACPLLSTLQPCK